MDFFSDKTRPAANQVADPLFSLAVISMIVMIYCVAWLASSPIR